LKSPARGKSDGARWRGRIGKGDSEDEGRITSEGGGKGRNLRSARQRGMEKLQTNGLSAYVGSGKEKTTRIENNPGRKIIPGSRRKTKRENKKSEKNWRRVRGVPSLGKQKGKPSIGRQ